MEKEIKIEEREVYEVYGFDTRYIRVEKIFEIEKGLFKKRLVKIVRYSHHTGDLGAFFKKEIWGDIEYEELKKRIICIKKL